MFGFHRQVLALLAVVLGADSLRAGEPPRLLASWMERQARVVAFSPDGRWLVSGGDEGGPLRAAGLGEKRAVLNAPPADLAA